jgi:hypothetical protein
MNKADRLNQAKVNTALGNDPSTGKPYVPGSAKANLALAKKFGQPAAAAADQTAGTATTITNPSQANQTVRPDPAAAVPAAVPAASDGTTQDIERLKRLAIGGEQPAAPAPSEPAPVAPAPAEPDTRGAAAMASKSKSDGSDTDDKILNWQASQPATMPGSDTAAGAMASSSSSNTAAEPRDAATVPAAALGQRTTPNVSADTGLDATPKKVAGTSNVATGSDDEMAWRAKNPNWAMTNQQYPGAGQWDPRTGRSKKLQAQADANAATVKGFLNKINPFAKKAAPAPAPEQGVTTQAVPPQPDMQPRPLTQSVDNNAELSRMKKLSGL